MASGVKLENFDAADNLIKDLDRVCQEYKENVLTK